MHPVAHWNPTRDCWETTSQASLFSEQPDVYSETWPPSGLMLRGACYQLPPWEHPTDEIASSSLLPTPSASLASNGGSQHPHERRSGGHSAQLHDVVEHLA